VDDGVDVGVDVDIVDFKGENRFDDRFRILMWIIYWIIFSSCGLVYWGINFKLIIFYFFIAGTIIGFGYFSNSSNFLNLFYFILDFYSAAKFTLLPYTNLLYFIQIASQHRTSFFTATFFNAGACWSPPTMLLSLINKTYFFKLTAASL